MHKAARRIPSDFQTAHAQKKTKNGSTGHKHMKK